MRGKGEGAIYKRRNDGLWCASVELPSRDGKRRRKVIASKDKNTVIRRLREVKQQVETRGNLQTSGQTLESWIDLWFESIALKKIRPKTAATYRTLIRKHIVPTIGSVRLDRLTAEHVRSLATTMIDVRGLSSTSAMQAHRILSSALKDAEREGRVIRNVAALTDAPRPARKCLAVLTANDGIRVLRTVVDERLGSRWAAALFTGARQGELLGLELDRVGDCLDLSWQLQRLPWQHGCRDTCGQRRGWDCPEKRMVAPPDWEHRHLMGGLWLSRPKSTAGWRVIPLVEPLRSILERRIDEARREPNPFGLVWTSEAKRRPGAEGSNVNGSPLDPSKDNKAWHAVLARAGVDDVRLHDARHTAASLLLQAGVPEAVIMKILGHSSYVVTRAYQNIDRRQLGEAMAKLSGLLEPGDGSERAVA